MLFFNGNSHSDETVSVVSILVLLDAVFQQQWEAEIKTKEGVSILVLLDAVFQQGETRH